jgi:hypothetical protein
MNLRQLIRFYRERLVSGSVSMSQHRRVVQFYNQLADNKLKKLLAHFGENASWDWQESTFYTPNGEFFLSKDTLVMQPMAVLLRGETTYINYWETAPLTKTRGLATSAHPI